MSEEKKYGIRGYPRFNPSTGLPIYTSYTLNKWGSESMYAEEIADEPLTYSEAQALLKLLEEV